MGIKYLGLNINYNKDSKYDISLAKVPKPSYFIYKCYQLGIKTAAIIIDIYKKVLVSNLLYGSELWGVDE